MVYVNFKIRVLTSLVAVALLVSLADAKVPQFPRVDQFPEDSPNVCRCSQNGVCVCEPGSDCGCLTSGQYRWVETDKANQVALYNGNVQQGNWWVNEGEYRMLVEGMFVRAPCPVSAPNASALTGRKTTPVTIPINRPTPFYGINAQPSFLQPQRDPDQGRYMGQGFVIPQGRGGGSCGPGG